MNKNQQLFEEAKNYLPGGVNSPVRAFSNVGSIPPFITRAKGSHIYDAEGTEYLDYVGSWGPMLLGHADDRVVEAVCRAAQNSLSFGAPSEAETILAKMICKAVPSVEMVRMVNSGTEATMSAIRLARGYTGRNKIIKFAGCYHGHSDSLLIKAGSGLLTNGTPSSLGVPSELAEHTIVLPYNNAEAVQTAFERYPEEIACVITEPVAGNMGVIPPKEGFLQSLSNLTKQYGALLILDEVMTGFRVSYGGAQELYGITPDLTTFGKIIGGGMPVGAYGGRRDIMEQVAPLGGVYQAGTLSGNPVAMAAGITTLTILEENKQIYQKTGEQTKRLCEGIRQEAQDCGFSAYAAFVGSMGCIFFSKQEVIDFETASACDLSLFGRYFNGMLKHGIYLAPSQFEAIFLSAAHTEQEIERTISVAKTVFQSM